MLLLGNGWLSAIYEYRIQKGDRLCVPPTHGQRSCCPPARRPLEHTPSMHHSVKGYKRGQLSAAPALLLAPIVVLVVNDDDVPALAKLQGSERERGWRRGGVRCARGREVVVHY